MKYHLGCGSNYINGYVNVDFPPENHNVNHDIRVDVYADILKMKYDVCNEIRSHHFFEHFNYFETFALLYKWTIALQLNGQLIIDVPDLEELCRAYLNGDVDTRFIVARYLFGSHEADWAYHINGWSQSTLTKLLNDLGYQVIDVKKYGSYLEKKPNCGMSISAKLNSKLSSTELLDVIQNYLSLYKNGDTDFENRLYGYFVDQFKKLIS